MSVSSSGLASRVLVIASLVFSVAIVGCGDESSTSQEDGSSSPLDTQNSDNDNSDDEAPTTSVNVSPNQGGGSGQAGGGQGPGDTPNPGGGDAGLFDDVFVYAQSAKDLYRVDPDTNDVTLIGPFIWPLGSDSMTDIALNKDGVMAGISFNKLYLVSTDTAECEYRGDLSQSMNGLTFVPRDFDDPEGEEMLVGVANDGTLYELDLDTGASRVIGNYGSGISSSGDIVAVYGAGMLATVKKSGSANDWLAQVNPQTGEATLIGNIGERGLYGIGYWRQQVFGFSSSGRFVLIDANTARSTLVATHPVSWWGAGVTTKAPVKLKVGH